MENQNAIASDEQQKNRVPAAGQQLYASIKKSSKYAAQNNDATRYGFGLPFKVRIDPAYGDYCVQGGPGGQYRLADVQLYVIVDGVQLRIR